MGTFILRRLLIAIPTLLGVSFIVFMMLHTAGGDAAEVTLGSRADAESLARLRHELGIDRPLPVQYADFISHAVRGDLGVSYRSNTPVSEEVFGRLPATIELAVVSMAIAVLIGVTLGVLAAIRRHSWVDLSTTIGALLGVSI
ncbi:MAG: ABC transporter permease, partial [Thermomicrobiales bacterium]